jgi:formate dehydrogenase
LTYTFLELEKEVGAKRVESFDEFLSKCDIITINCPLYERTRGLFNEQALSKMKKGAYLVNTARGAIVDRDALAKAVNSGHIAGYAGDVWYPQPAPKVCFIQMLNAFLKASDPHLLYIIAK